MNYSGSLFGDGGLLFQQWSQVQTQSEENRIGWQQYGHSGFPSFALTFAIGGILPCVEF